MGRMGRMMVGEMMVWQDFFILLPAGPVGCRVRIFGDLG
jgi:hypothetical protein